MSEVGSKKVRPGPSQRPWSIALGLILALSSIYLVGFTIGESHPGPALITVLILAPIFYVLPRRIYEAFEGRRTPNRAVGATGATGVAALRPTSSKGEE